MPWNSNLWNSKAEKEKSSGQKNTGRGWNSEWKIIRKVLISIFQVTTLNSYKFLFTDVSKTENLIPWNSNLWNSKAEKKKFPEQKNTDFRILSESTIQISFIREIDILKSHCRNNQFINQSIIVEKQIQNGAGLEFKMLKTTKVQSSESNISIDKFYDLSYQQRCI